MIRLIIQNRSVSYHKLVLHTFIGSNWRKSLRKSSFSDTFTIILKLYTHCICQRLTLIFKLDINFWKEAVKVKKIQKPSSEGNQTFFQEENYYKAFFWSNLISLMKTNNEKIIQEATKNILFVEQSWIWFTYRGKLLNKKFWGLYIVVIFCGLSLVLIDFWQWS